MLSRSRLVQDCHEHGSIFPPLGVAVSARINVGCNGLRWKTMWRNPAVYLALAVSFGIALLDGRNKWVPAEVLILAFVGSLF